MRFIWEMKTTGQRHLFPCAAAVTMDDILRLCWHRLKATSRREMPSPRVAPAHALLARYNRPMPKPTVLVVDDEPDLCELLSITLQRMDLDPRTANSVADAQRLLKTEQLDLCLTDMQLPDGDGLELVN